MITIRKATLADVSPLTQIGSETFVESFAADNTPEDVALYLAATFTKAAQEKELQDPQRLIFLASEESQVVGYLHLMKKPHALHIVRLYLLKSQHGKGLAHELMQLAVDEATNLHFTKVTLGVWEKNFRAQAFYEKWGFKRIGQEKFLLGTDLQNDFVLEKTIDPDQN